MLTGNYKDYHGIQGKYLPLDYYDIHLDAGSKIILDVQGENRSVMIFTLESAAVVSSKKVAAKTAAKLGDGETVTIETQNQPIEILLMSSLKLSEPVAWFGPIVMNDREELAEAFRELEEGTFIKQQASYENA